VLNAISLFLMLASALLALALMRGGRRDAGRSAVGNDEPGW
jgi:hypothetical protein